MNAASFHPRDELCPGIIYKQANTPKNPEQSSPAYLWSDSRSVYLIGGVFSTTQTPLIVGGVESGGRLQAASGQKPIPHYPEWSKSRRHVVHRVIKDFDGS